jgi:hypothetical protein
VELFSSRIAHAEVKPGKVTLLPLNYSQTGRAASTGHRNDTDRRLIENPKARLFREAEMRLCSGNRPQAVAGTTESNLNDRKEA